MTYGQRIVYKTELVQRNNWHQIIHTIEDGKGRDTETERERV